MHYWRVPEGEGATSVYVAPMDHRVASPDSKPSLKISWPLIVLGTATVAARNMRAPRIDRLVILENGSLYNKKGATFTIVQLTA